eukprot:SAG11_NODE_6981_length_1214_cov_3.242152_1_plen_90_part_10
MLISVYLVTLESPLTKSTTHGTIVDRASYLLLKHFIVAELWNLEVEVNGGVLIHLIRILNKIEFFEKNTQNSVKKVLVNPIRISRHRSQP